MQPRQRNFGDTLSDTLKTGFGAYNQRSDELTLQNVLQQLPPDAPPQQVLQTIMGARTYDNAAKEQALSNYLKAQQMQNQTAGLGQKEAIAQQNIASRERLAEENRRSREEVAAANRASREEIAKSRTPKLGKTDEELKREEDLLVLDGYPPEIAERYVRETPGVRAQLEQQHKEMKARGLRNPLNPQQAQAEQPSVAETPTPVKSDAWPELPIPPETTPAERERWRANNQRDNNKLLKETKGKTTAHTNALIRFNRLEQLNESGKLPSGLGRLAINPETGDPYGVASLAGIVTPETQDFVKTLNDFLIDAKNYFGGRVTNFDVGAFKSRLPTLLNTDGGRRLIIQQMKLMEELQLANDRELENALKHYGRNASYSDIQGIVDEKVGDREQDLIRRLDSLDVAVGKLEQINKDPRLKGMKLIQSKDGKFLAVPEAKAEEAKSRGYVVW